MRMRVAKADAVHGQGFLSMVKRLFLGRQPTESIADLYPATSVTATWPMTPPVRPVAAALDDILSARIALDLFDLLADLPGGADAATLAARINAGGEMAVSAVEVQATLEQLFDQGQVAGYGPIFCLPERVTALRTQWLLRASLVMPDARRDPAAERRKNEAMGRLCQWNGWNMPIARGLTN
ncbi:hypothetical protein NYR55_08085 [Sphingomonas sp. BGYR3]|uniref:hypothetical protein n=1 Tax=Sphingomonas sp. BGYR3 TaxID=2975483 RepID=UPI0021A26CDA|nr:hypothetical protein [Sphingomonas sp. BGYR3]MDG5488572.1 hypothetical protein [Sphingomonas sp. BGYR3]